MKFSTPTAAALPMAASPPGAGTLGNQFQLAGSEWRLNLVTRATGMSVGIGHLKATLSDGSKHTVWIQFQ